MTADHDRLQNEEQSRSDRSYTYGSIVKLLRKYAFIFTILGVCFTAANIVLSRHDELLGLATGLSRDATLIEKQLYLASKSNGGSCYPARLIENDPEFNVSLKVLMNYYEHATERANSWWFFKGGFDDAIMCPLGKHVEIFLDGKSREGLWFAEAPLLKVEMPNVRETYRRISPKLDECVPYWRPASPRLCPN